MSGRPKTTDAVDRRRRLKPCYEHRTPLRIQPPLSWWEGRTALRLACGRCRFPGPAPRRAAHQGSALRSSPGRGLADSLGSCQRMVDQAAMSDRRHASPKRDAGVGGGDATYYVEKFESRWRVTYEDAPIGVLDDARDASRFACDVARMQAQIGRVTWVIVVAEVEEVHRFETRADPIKPLERFLNNIFRKVEIAGRMALE
jgi:hypothetical protein